VPTRRAFLLAGGRLAAGGLLAGCAVPTVGGPGSGNRPDGAAVLTERPGTGGSAPGPLPAPGDHPLSLGAARNPVLHVPPGLVPGDPAPLVVTLHGAGGNAAGALALLLQPADERGLLLLAPVSQGPTWDAIRAGYGPDVELIDRALREVFSMVEVDAERVAVAGFSDGASYALGLGLANGRLFRRVLAFSPGFVPPGPRAGDPAIFVSHGDADPVLPIERTSRRIVPALQDDGYDVTYREFPGPHAVPPQIAREAVDWLDWTRP
jgi:predicted esterase